MDPKEFQDFFGEKLSDCYGLEFWLAQRMGWVERLQGRWHLTSKGVFAYHYFEGFYTLKYIDRMWNVLAKEDFPTSITL